MNTKVGRKPVIKRENNEPTRPQSHWRRGGRSGFPESPFWSPWPWKRRYDP